MSVSGVNNPNASQALDSILGPSKPLDERVEQKALGQEDFFKLLTTQLATQDPLEPMEDTAFIAQMANFSSLEMMNQLNKNFDNFTTSQDFRAAQNMIGKNVTMLIDGREITGEATAIEMIDDTIRVFVDDVGYNIENVFKVEAGSGEQDLASALNQTVQDSINAGLSGLTNESSEETESTGATATTSKQVEADVTP